jgi:putative transposase
MEGTGWCNAIPRISPRQWTLLAPLIPVAKPGGRPRTTDMHEVVNAIFYVLRGGCQ